MANNQPQAMAVAVTAKTAVSYRQHPEFLCLEELASLRELAKNANARLYLSVDRKAVHARDEESLA